MSRFPRTQKTGLDNYWLSSILIKYYNPGVTVPPSSPPFVASSSPGDRGLVLGLFISTCLLSIVSWYTTWQGMALYLAGWFALLASLGVQSALVLVAWLVGRVRTGRGLLIGVYVITAIASIAFSYASLQTWFAARERPALVQRGLYDTILVSAGRAEQLLSDALVEAQRHALALDELTASERSQGHVSQAQDADPYVARIREAVALEGRSTREGAGEGVRHAAFDRYAKLAHQSLDRLRAARKGLADFKGRTQPGDSSEQQIRAYREVYDALPWREVEEALHDPRFTQPPVPTLGAHLDHAGSGQEDLLLAFQELVTAPTARHILALLLATFIDVIVFLLAFASGPHLAGPSEGRWIAASAVLDGVEPLLFIRGLLRKMAPGEGGLGHLDPGLLSPGERHFCMLLCARGRAIVLEREGRRAILVDEDLHESLADALSAPSLRLRATPLPADA
jgi:hypothetical protein